MAAPRADTWPILLALTYFLCVTLFYAALHCTTAYLSTEYLYRTEHLRRFTLYRTGFSPFTPQRAPILQTPGW